MYLKNPKAKTVLIGFVCFFAICAGLFAYAHHIGSPVLESGRLEWISRVIYGPNVRREIARLKHAKELSPEIFPITALCYHEVRPDRADDFLNVSPEILRRHIREFREAGFTFIDVDDLRQYEAGAAQPPQKAVLLSFDDGYADNYKYAYPVLREEKVTGTFFVVSSMVGKDNRMTAGQLKEMQANGMKIGSHTVNHEVLTKKSAEQIDYELRVSREQLETMLGKPVYALAYPAGYVNSTVQSIAEKYYDMAFIASVIPDSKQTRYTLQRYGVFNWNEHIESIFRNR